MCWPQLQVAAAALLPFGRLRRWLNRVVHHDYFLCTVENGFRLYGKRRSNSGVGEVNNGARPDSDRIHYQMS
jgi:hypothetical protein